MIRLVYIHIDILFHYLKIDCHSWLSKSISLRLLNIIKIKILLLFISILTQSSRVLKILSHRQQVRCNYVQQLIHVNIFLSFLNSIREFYLICLKQYLYLLKLLVESTICKLQCFCIICNVQSSEIYREVLHLWQLFPYKDEEKLKNVRVILQKINSFNKV